MSSLKIIGLLHLLNFWAHQKKITIYSLFGSHCIRDFGGLGDFVRFGDLTVFFGAMIELMIFNV